MSRHTSILTMSLLLLTLMGSAGQAGADPVGPGEGTLRANARPGFYLGFGLMGQEIDLDPQGTGIAPLQIEPEGAGPAFTAGYAFNDHFALELRLAGSEHETNQPGLEAFFGQVQIDAVTHFRPGRRFQPYVAGGLGGAAFGVTGDGIDDTVISGGQIDFGGGFEYHMNAHFAIGLDMRLAIQRFEEKHIELDDDRSSTLSIDQSGDSSSWSLGVVYSF